MTAQTGKAKDKAKTLEEYRLVGADDDPPEGDPPPASNQTSDEKGRIPPERRPWKREAIYRSPICIAVRLSVIESDCRNEEEVSAAKTALFRYLRQLNQAVMDHGIVLPLAAVITAPRQDAETPLTQALKGWGGDQSWHRGGFTLYVETDQDTVEKRLLDLLSPEAEAMDPKKFQQRDVAWFATNLRHAANEQRTDPISQIARDVMRLCAADLDTAVRDANGKTRFPNLETWKAERLLEASRLEASRLDDEGGPA